MDPYSELVSKRRHMLAQTERLLSEMVASLKVMEPIWEQDAYVQYLEACKHPIVPNTLNLTIQLRKLIEVNQARSLLCFDSYMAVCELLARRRDGEPFVRFMKENMHDWDGMHENISLMSNIIEGLRILVTDGEEKYRDWQLASARKLKG